MAFSRLGTGGTGQNKTSGTTVLSDQIGGTLAVGELLVVCVSGDNTGTSDATTGSAGGEIVSVTDPRGNTYVKVCERVNGSPGAGAGAVTAVFYCVITTAIQSTDQLTATFANAVVAKAISFQRYSKGASTTIAVQGYAAGSGEENVASSAATLSSMPSREYLFAVGCAVEAADTLNIIYEADYVAAGARGTSGNPAASNIQCTPATRVATVTDETCSITTISPSSDIAFILAALYEETATQNGSGTAQGGSSVSGAASEILGAAGVAQGIGSIATAAATIILLGALACGGVGTASGSGTVVQSAAATAQGASEASGAASEILGGAGTAEGNSESSGTASGIFPGSGSAQGASETAGAAQEILGGTGTAEGTSSASGAGTVLTAGNPSGTAQGNSQVQIGTYIIFGDQVIEVPGYLLILGGSASLSGDGAASGAAALILGGAGDAQGASQASGDAIVVSAGSSATAQGASEASGAASIGLYGSAVASGESSASGAGTVVLAGLSGSAEARGESASSGSAFLILGAAGSAEGIGTAAGAGGGIFSASGAAQGEGRASAGGYVVPLHPILDVPYFMDDLAALFADTGIDITVAGQTVKGFLEDSSEELLEGIGVGIGIELVAKVETGSLPGLAVGASLTANGQTWKVRKFLQTGDGAVTLIFLAYD